MFCANQMSFEYFYFVPILLTLTSHHWFVSDVDNQYDWFKTFIIPVTLFSSSRNKH